MCTVFLIVTLLDLNFLNAVSPDLEKFEKRYQKKFNLYKEPLQWHLWTLLRFILQFLPSFHLGLDRHSNELKTISFQHNFWLFDEQVFTDEVTKKILWDASNNEKESFYIWVPAFYKELATYFQKMLPLSNQFLCD